MKQMIFMKKFVKRIAAMGAAVMMMSSMVIGASAADSKAFSLRNTPGAPSSDNVTSKTLNFKQHNLVNTLHIPN